MTELIITHPGSSHFDEFFAICLLLATHPNTDFTIERREPTPEEVDDPSIWVLDIGGEHNPKKRNFDHHQDIELSASFVLVAQALGYEESLSALPWWNFKDRIDRFGPAKVGAEIGTTSLRTTYSPMEGWMLDMFATAPNALPTIMRQFGQKAIESGRKLTEQLDRWEKARRVELNGYTILISESDEAEGAQEFNFRQEKPAAACVTWDSRGQGWKLMRFDNAPEINFAKLEGRPDIRFTHKTGFVAKTRRRIPVEEVLELVRIALPEAP
ncbi:MYG1 family protein [Desulfoluna sp.]|uniref:MYG1 family protein n=1 Tax=Desulfoluna sp. TaxID=2045199 RepID=UPI00260EF2FD|nr:MYG1 family protein [Desulfoluna sp.]